MIELLRALWPKPPKDAYLTVWEMPGKESLHFSIREVLKCGPKDEAELIEQLEGHCVYFGLGLRCGGLDTMTRGGKKHVNYLPGFALDVDVYNPDNPGAHKAMDLPQTDDDVDTILADAPKPTAIVHTGNGYHFYWCFDEPLHLTCKAERDAAANAFEAFQRPFIDRAAEHGWKLDLTASIDRVWRLPGFKNMKGSR